MFQTFMSVFSKALEYEYRKYGITVQTVEGSFVVTNLTAFSNYLTNEGQNRAEEFSQPFPNPVVLYPYICRITQATITFIIIIR